MASLFGLFGAAITLVAWWSRRSHAQHYLVFAVSLATLAVPLPLVDFPASAAYVTILAFAGLSQIAGGIFDHLLLVRTMKPLPEEDDDGAV